jgi:hypothetical protein
MLQRRVKVFARQLVVITVPRHMQHSLTIVGLWSMRRQRYCGVWGHLLVWIGMLRCSNTGNNVCSTTSPGTRATVELWNDIMLGLEVSFKEIADDGLVAF